MKKQPTPARLAHLRMKHAFPLIVVSCLIQLLMPTHLLAAHPLLEELLLGLSPICTVLGLCILLLVSLRFVFGKLTAGGRRLFKAGQRGMRTLRALLFGSETDTSVSLKDVVLVWNDAQHLRMALYGVTPEMEQSRLERCHRPGRPVPPLRIPAHQAHLASEYDALLRALRHFGFPELAQVQPMLTQVQLAPRDFALLQQWQASLYTRLQQSQQDVQAQQERAHAALFAAQALLESIGLDPAAVDDPGYQRLQGRYELLTTLLEDRRTPPELVQRGAHDLRRSLEMLREHLRASRQQQQEHHEAPSRNAAPERRTSARTPKTGKLTQRPL